jgi:hypothetical protein
VREKPSCLGWLSFWSSFDAPNLYIPLSPTDVVQQWLQHFNAGDAGGLERLYADDAVNHQMPNDAVAGRSAIGEMFRREFAAAPEMNCIPVQIIAQGEWAVLEWRDPKGFRGCGFFHVVAGLIQVQRGYWDRLSFNRLYGVG